MQHQLITLSPVERVNRAVGSYPARRNVQDGQEIKAPEGHAYVPLEERPEYDSSTHRIERELTSERDGWKVIELTPEELASRNTAPPISLQRHQFDAALSLSGISEADLNQTVEAIEDPQIKMLATIGLAKAPNIAEDNPIVSILSGALGLNKEQVRAIFELGQTLYQTTPSEI